MSPAAVAGDYVGNDGVAGDLVRALQWCAVAESLPTDGGSVTEQCTSIQGIQAHVRSCLVRVFDFSQNLNDLRADAS